MNKKKILALTITGMMLLPTVAYAKGNPHTAQNGGQQVVSQEKTSQSTQENSKKGNGQGAAAQSKESNKNKGEAKKQENQEKKDEKKQQIEAFKTQMKAKHETMKQIRQQTKAVKQQVESKSSQIKAIVADIEAGKKTLSEDMLNTLLSKVDSLKGDSEQVKATAGVNSEVADAQDKVNKKDFNNALASLDKVIAKLQARLDALKKLNADLDDILAIANLATAPATSDAQTQTTTDTSTTSTDSTSGSTTGSN